jgi:hypothetical protein
VARPIEELIGCLVEVNGMIEEGEPDEFRRLCRGDLTDEEVEMVRKGLFINQYATPWYTCRPLGSCPGGGGRATSPLFDGQ